MDPEEPSPPPSPKRPRLRLLVAPLLVALPGAYYLIQAARVSALSPFGRDQGIFQYVAWAMLQGETLYRDVRDVNGPLMALLHAALLALGGADEARFRLLDLLINVAVFGFVGACLPGLAPGRRGLERPTRIERAAFALAAVVVLGSQYLSYVPWHAAQRESFFNWFLLPSVGLQLTAQARYAGDSVEAAARRRRALLLAAGFLGAIPWFGKPTFAAFTLVQVLALLLDTEPGADPPARLGRLRRLSWFAVGAALAAAGSLVFCARFTDLGAFFRITLHDVPAMYRFIWPRDVGYLLSPQGRGVEAWYGLASTLVLCALVAAGRMPRRALVVALLPLAAVAGVIAQRKGFEYHYHTLSAAARLGALLFVAWLVERARAAAWPRRAREIAPLAAALALGLGVCVEAGGSPHRERLWLPGWLARAPARETEAYFSYFPEYDFFPWEMRRAAAFLRERTRPEDRVQTYGMDPYLLFLARRRSATPYIYLYDLSPGAALRGGSGGVPSEAERRVILEIRDASERDMLARLQADPPAAFVFMDRAPLLSYLDAREDFRFWCPRSSTWFEGRYEEAARMGAFRIYLRREGSGGRP